VGSMPSSQEMIGHQAVRVHVERIVGAGQDEVACAPGGERDIVAAGDSQRVGAGASHVDRIGQDRRQVGLERAADDLKRAARAAEDAGWMGGEEAICRPRAARS